MGGHIGSEFGSFLVNRSGMKLLMVGLNIVKPASFAVHPHVLRMHSVPCYRYSTKSIR